MIGRSINVFLASPTGLEIERQYAREVSSHINRTIGSKLGIQLNLLSWETSFYSDIDTDGQAVINRQLKKDYDIFIGIIWDRLGTPTRRSLSGTVEEYEAALSRHLFNPETIVMMFFKDSLSSAKATDPAELKLVDSFKSRVFSDGVLAYSFSEPQEFKDMLFDQLSMAVLDFNSRSKAVKPIIKDYILNDGRQKFQFQKESCYLAIVWKNKVLLTKRSSGQNIGPGLWQLPGGKKDGGENNCQTVIREVYEELGIKIDPSRVKYITNITRNSLGDNPNVLMRLHLFVYMSNEKVTDIRPEDSVERIQWLPLSSINKLKGSCLGAVCDLLHIIQRYVFTTLPLHEMAAYIKSGQSDFPSKLNGYSEESTQIFYSLLDVLGFINRQAPLNTHSEKTLALTKVLSDYSISEDVAFSAAGDGAWKSDILLLNKEDDLFRLQNAAFDDHAALATLLSYKLSKVSGVRNVCDLMIFCEIKGKKYILLRYDSFAGKLQIPSKGLERISGILNPEDENTAKFAVTERFSEKVSDAFSYRYLDTFSTTHLSSGSQGGVSRICNYNISVFSLRLREEQAKGFCELLYALNMHSKKLVENSEASRSVLKQASIFVWADINSLLNDNYLYEGTRVQGFAEIIEYFGEEMISSLAEKGTDLTPYARYLTTAL